MGVGGVLGVGVGGGGVLGSMSSLKRYSEKQSQSCILIG